MGTVGHIVPGPTCYSCSTSRLHDGLDALFQPPTGLSGNQPATVKIPVCPLGVLLALVHPCVGSTFPLLVWRAYTYLPVPRAALFSDFGSFSLSHTANSSGTQRINCSNKITSSKEISQSFVHFSK